MKAAGLEYVEAGTGEDPILCLHGIGGNTASFAPQLDALAKTRRIIALNLPGYGASDPLPGLTFPALAACVADFLAAKDIARAHLCGQSIGGMIALETACQYPDRVASLALIATTAAFGGRDDSFKDAFIAARLAPLDRGQTLPDLARDFVPEITGPDTAPEVIAAAEASMAAVPEATYRAIIRCLVTFNRRDDIAGLDLPCCLIAGQHDQNAPAKTMARMAEKIPGAAYHEIAGAGHLVNLEKGKETNAILTAFYGSLT